MRRISNPDLGRQANISPLPHTATHTVSSLSEQRLADQWPEVALELLRRDNLNSAQWAI